MQVRVHVRVVRLMHIVKTMDIMRIQVRVMKSWRRTRSMHVLLVHAKIRNGFGVSVPVGQSTQCAALVCAYAIQAVDIAGVDPAESEMG